MKQYVQEVLALLDEDLIVLERQATTIRALSRALATDDLDGLRALKEELSEVEKVARVQDVRRAAFREDVGRRLGVDGSNVNLSLLMPLADEADRLALRDRQERLSVAIESISRARIATSVVLYEKARLNRMIVRALFPTAAGHQSYAADGQARAADSPSIMEVEI